MGKDLNNKNSKVISFDYVMVRSSQHCGHDKIALLKTVSFFLFTARPPSVLDSQTSRSFDFPTIQRQLFLHWRQPSWTNSQMSWQAYPLKVSQWHYAPRDQTSCIEQKAFAAKITLSAQSHMAVSSWASFSNLFWPQTCLLTIQTLPTIRNKKEQLACRLLEQQLNLFQHLCWKLATTELQPSWPATCVATPEADDGECDGEPVGSSTYNLLKDRQPQELPIGL